MKHTLKIFLVLVAVLCLSSIDERVSRLSPTAVADTCMVGGVISTNTTWSTASCDTYVIYGNLLVEEGATLTIMPGVVVAFQQNYRLEVGGALTARGEVSDSIIFTGWQSTQNPDWWYCIKFRNSSIDTACSLLYCRIEYASYGVWCDTAGPTISHCNIRNCGFAGIRSFYASPKVISNTIEENNYGLVIDYGSYGGVATVTYGNIFKANRNHGIVACGYNLSAIIQADTIKQNQGRGISFGEWGSTDFATISSCEIIDHDGGSGIYIKLPGNYRISSNFISENTAVNGGGIYMIDGFALIDSNCITGNWATSSGNTAGGIYFSGVDSARVQYNDIVGNSGAAKYVYEVYSGVPSSPDIHGEYNWWGTTDSVEIANLIYDYYDNFDFHKFIFAPYATEPYCEIWIKVTAPNGGEILCADSLYEITWNSRGAIDSVAIEYSTNSGSSWMPITGSMPNDGSYSWIVPNTPSNNCLVKISDAKDGDPADMSDGYFTIISEPTIVVKSPNGGETWTIGTTHDITWDHFCFSDSVIIEYTTDNGATWDTIVDTTTNDGVYSWTTPDTPSDSCLVRISDVVDNIPSDESDNLFSIVTWIRGDVNGDGLIDLGDVLYLISYLYKGGPAPDPLEAGDCNCDELVDLGDVLYLISYLYKGGPPPGCP